MTLDRATVEQMTWKNVTQENLEALREDWLRKEEALERIGSGERLTHDQIQALALRVTGEEEEAL